MRSTTSSFVSLARGGRLSFFIGRFVVLHGCIIYVDQIVSRAA